MNRILIIAIALTGCLATTTARAAENAELRLEPCTIEWVDGTTLEGRLAVQFDMADHLIVYAPRLSMMRSCMKDLIHAVTVNGKRERLNARRDLTEEQSKRIHGESWFGEPPETGRRPAYTAETWQPPEQLLVWADPGNSGRLEEASNWLLNGKRLSTMPFNKEQRRADGHAFDMNTDILIPEAREAYQVAFGNRKRGGFKARHIAVGNNAKLKASVLSVAGNVRLTRLGRLRVRYTIAFRGDRDTYFLNDKPPFTAEENNALQGGYPTANYINKIGYSVAQYLRVEKTAGASVEFIGTTQTSDDFQMPSGITIVAPGSQLMPGKRSTQTIGKDAVLRLH
ncbi:MAG: hypothetical protein KGY81_09665, partial [Phycisphaerae bacterium]|nr:hypothetical protein [Phycisphaerae bacterium]